MAHSGHMSGLRYALVTVLSATIGAAQAPPSLPLEVRATFVDLNRDAAGWLVLDEDQRWDVSRIERHLREMRREFEGTNDLHTIEHAACKLIASTVMFVTYRRLVDPHHDQ